MATYTVDTTADTVDPGDGSLGLRVALALADVDATTGDKIDFDSSVQGQTIVLAGSQLTANSDVTIDGGAGVTIDANQASRVLLVQGDFGTDVSLQHLTITGGRTTGDLTKYSGGGIRADRYTTLALDHSTVSATARRASIPTAAGSSAITP